jgi:hypothetical protein
MQNLQKCCCMYSSYCVYALITCFIYLLFVNIHFIKRGILQDYKAPHMRWSGRCCAILSSRMSSNRTAPSTTVHFETVTMVIMTCVENLNLMYMCIFMLGYIIVNLWWYVRLHCKFEICDDMFMLSSCIVDLSFLLWSIYIAFWFKVAAKS